MGDQTVFCERQKLEVLYTNKRNTVFTWIEERMIVYNMNNNECCFIQGVLCVEEVNVGDDFIGLCDRSVHTNICPILKVKKLRPLEAYNRKFNITTMHKIK
jgi:hypothetical protein